MIADIIVKPHFPDIPLVNLSDFALRATPGQEGWGRFCHVVYPSGKPEDFRSCVVKDSR